MKLPFSMQRLPLKTSKELLSSFRRKMGDSSNSIVVPHKGALCRVVDDDSNVPSFVIEITISPDDNVLDITTRTRELHFSRHDFESSSRLFAILDTESINLVHRSAVQDFVHKRCPVFSKRDDDLMRLGLHTRAEDASADSDGTNPTFDEVWKSVVACCRHCTSGHDSSDEPTCLGLEGWMVFCRYIALAQYLEAKRRFSARHLQQTMRHRNSPRGSEMVVVDFPPPEPPAPISPEQLSSYEQRSEKGLPLPELDLDHSLLAAHDSSARRRGNLREQRDQGYNEGVKIAVFGSAKNATLLPQTGSLSSLEFAVSYSRRSARGNATATQDFGVVRRSMTDMKWLDDTFTSHKVLGGTLCGRILPPFPATSPSGGGVLSSHFPGDESSFNASSIKNTTGGAIHAAAAGVGRIRDVAKSFMGPLGSYLTNCPPDVRIDETSSSAPVASISQPASKKTALKKRNLNLALPEHYYNPNSPVGKARQLERYLNYLLEHPALSTSFPLNVILTVSLDGLAARTPLFIANFSHLCVVELQASQSGLEAAHQSLDECSRLSKELKDQTPNLDDGKLGISLSPNYAWVRTAAQAAVALQVHGMLENTGMQSASARLQHASLPAFGPTARSSGWDEVDVVSADVRDSPTCTGDAVNAREVHNFEDGVVNADGFDLLPLPVPAPERSILTVGSATNAPAIEASGEERFHYGSGNLEGRYPIDYEDDSGSVFLGDIAVDENIDKLREVIGSVDNTLSRCLVSSGGIGKAHRERLSLHLNVVRGLDSWEGMRGRFICQRSLMKGVACVEQSKETFEESDLALIDGTLRRLYAPPV